MYSCGKIKMPDGTVIHSISPSEECPCDCSTAEILAYIVDNVPDFKIGNKLTIEYLPFGWNVSISSVPRGGDARTRQH